MDVLKDIVSNEFVVDVTFYLSGDNYFGKAFLINGLAAESDNVDLNDMLIQLYKEVIRLSSFAKN